MKLGSEQERILRGLTNRHRYGRAGDGKEEGWATAQWLAEGCGHAYDTPWASSRLPGLIKRGLVERGARGYYRITDAGRAALEPTP